MWVSLLLRAGMGSEDWEGVYLALRVMQVGRWAGGQVGEFLLFTTVESLFSSSKPA